MVRVLKSVFVGNHLVGEVSGRARVVELRSGVERSEEAGLEVFSFPGVGKIEV